MIVRVDKSFVKDTDKINSKKVLLSIAAVIERVQDAKSTMEIKNLKKLKGHLNHYRIKFESYRAGIIINGSEVILERFLHRRDIYKYYP